MSETGVPLRVLGLLRDAGYPDFADALAARLTPWLLRRWLRGMTKSLSRWNRASAAAAFAARRFAAACDRAGIPAED